MNRRKAADLQAVLNDPSNQNQETFEGYFTTFCKINELYIDELNARFNNPPLDPILAMHKVITAKTMDECVSADCFVGTLQRRSGFNGIAK